MGFPLDLSTNFRPALACAARMWSDFPKLFDRPPARLEILVSSDSSSGLFGKPVVQEQGHLFSIIADRANFALADLAAGFGGISVSHAIASDAAKLRYYFLEPLAYVMIAARHAAFVHASCVTLNGRAAVLCGPSGAGKTCLAYACARRGWTFVSGDAVAFLEESSGRRIVGRPFEIRFRHSAVRLFPELARFRAVLRPNEKIDIEVDPRALRVSCAVESTASLLVLLRRENGIEAPSVDPVSSSEVRRMLQDGICFGDHLVRLRHARVLDRLAQVPAVRLRYSGLDAAETKLRALLGGN